MLLGNAQEIVDSEDQYTVADWSLPLRVMGTFAHFGLLAPLSIAGLLITWPQRRRFALIHWMIVAYVASLLPFFVCGRFRHPLVPLLILIAAAGLAEFPRWLGKSPTRQRKICAGAVLAMLIFTHLPTGVLEPAVRSVTYYNMGTAFNERGEKAEAIKYYRRSIELQPRFVPANNNLAAVLVEGGELDEAEAIYRTILEIDPKAKLAHFSLGQILRNRDERDATIEHFRHAINADRDFLEAHFALARVLTEQEAWTEAASHYRRVLEIDPSRDGVRGLLEVVVKKGESANFR